MNNSWWGARDKKRSKPLPEPRLPLKGAGGACWSHGERVSHHGATGWLTPGMVPAGAGTNRKGGGGGAEKERVVVV